MWLWSMKYFDNAKRVRKRYFQNELQASSKKIFGGYVWHQHELESLEIMRSYCVALESEILFQLVRMLNESGKDLFSMSLRLVLKRSLEAKFDLFKSWYDHLLVDKTTL